MSTKPQIHSSVPPHFPLSSILKITARMQNSAPFGNLIPSAVGTVTDIAKRRSRGCVVFLCLGMFQCGRTQRSAPTRKFVLCPSTTNQIPPPNATPGGLWSGCAGSRTFQPTGVTSHGSFGVWQGGHRHRWSQSRNQSDKAPS